MTIQIVIAEAREETRVLGPFAGRADRDAVTMAMLLQALRPAATVVFIFKSQTGTSAFTAAEILADRAEADRIAKEEGLAMVDALTDPSLRAQPAPAPKTFAAIEANTSAPKEEPPPRRPRPDPDEDELATTKAPRNPDDDEVAHA